MDTVELALDTGRSEEEVTLEWSTGSDDVGSGAVTVASDADAAARNVTVESPPVEESGGGGGGGGGLQLRTEFTFENVGALRSIVFDSEVSGTVEVSQIDPSESDVRAIARQVGGADGPEGVEVISAIDISPSSRSARQASATIEMVASVDELGDPDDAAVAHRTDSGWELIEPEVAAVQDGQAILQYEIDSFSAFAIVDTNPERATTTSTPATGSTGPATATPEPEPEETISVQTRTPEPQEDVETPQPTPVDEGEAGGFPVLPLVGLLVVVGAVVALLVLRGRSSR